MGCDSGLFELTGLPAQTVGTGVSGEVKDSSIYGKKGSAQSAIFVARNRFAVLHKPGQVRSIPRLFISLCREPLIDFFPCHRQLIEVRDLSNSVVKIIKPPVQTNEVFYGGTAGFILSSTSVVLYDIQQQKTIAEVSSPPVKYVV